MLLDRIVGSAGDTQEKINERFKVQSNAMKKKAEYAADATIVEMAEFLTAICIEDPDVTPEPFPHIEILTEYGKIVFFDADKGWLDDNQVMETVTVRCLLNAKILINPDTVSSFNERNDGMELIKSVDAYCLQSDFTIGDYNKVSELLESISGISRKAYNLYLADY